MVDLDMGAPAPEKTEKKDPETVDVQGEKIAVPAMRADGKSLAERAKAFVVSSVETLHEAQKISLECARRKKVIDERFKAVREKTKAAKVAADRANSSVIALIDELKKPYDDAMAILDPKARDWERAENKRLADEAAEKQRKEQERLDAERQKEIDDANAKAKEAAESGDTSGAQEAEALAVELAQAPPPVAAVEVPKVESAAGTSNRKHMKAILVDLGELVRAIAAGKAPLPLVTFDQSEGDALARASGGSVSYPGVVFKDVGSTAHRV